MRGVIAASAALVSMRNVSGSQSTNTGVPPARTTASVSSATPLSFEPNVGQTDARVRFVARGRDYIAFLTDGAATLSIQRPYASASSAESAGRSGSPAAASATGSSSSSPGRRWLS